MSLEKLKLDMQQLRQLSPEALGFYHCVLANCNVIDILEGDKDDILGFGIAVKRPEHAVDEPTAVRISSMNTH